MFDVFPGNPDDPDATGPHDLRTSLDLVLATGEPEVMTLSRYDLEDPGRPATFEQRYWSVVTTPLTDEHGHVTTIMVSGSEVTPIISQLRAQASSA